MFVAVEVCEQGMERRLPEELVARGRGLSLEGRVVDLARVSCGSWGVDIASCYGRDLDK